MKTPNIDFGKCVDTNHVLKDVSQVDDPYLRIMILTGILGNIQKSKLDKELEKIDLTASQLQVLLYLMHFGDKEHEATSREMEQMFHVSNPTMAGILKRLELKGFITRNPSPSDKRNKLVKIAIDYKDLWDMVQKMFKGEKEKLFRGFSEADMQAFESMLKRLVVNVEAD